MQANEARALASVFENEGGYSNKPADPGGPTNFGITQRTLAAWRKHPVTEQDAEPVRPRGAGHRGLPSPRGCILAP